jgi:hypothetical protein
MLNKDPKARINAHDAYMDPWIQKKNFDPLDEANAKIALSNIKSFHVINRFLTF